MSSAPAAGVLIVQNGPDGGPRRLATWLAEDGLRPDVVHAYRGEPLPSRLDGHQALIVLGGAAMPDDFERMPWLADTRPLAAAALRGGVPYLGICLGGQLLAQIAGGAVKAQHGTPEVGSTRLTLRAEAGSDPLFAGLPAHPTAIERHVDTITELPAGAQWLVESDNCPYQAFRCGPAAWGLQFHPEVDAARLRGWDAEGLRGFGLDAGEVADRAERDEPAAVAVWREVARRFAGVVRGAAS
ncbi:type 1 glutamine amidotransferase [Streptomyces sp. NPDC051940]|uniref:type 1 glutamine amidotransferase n=1 Tax=Streptomyces sp. NPDC051940 TaxID=3155675 RepID=UPI003422077B